MLAAGTPATPSTAVKPTDRWPGVGHQAFALRTALPHACIRLDRNTLTATASIQPTAASRRYSVRIRYSYGGVPKVHVLAPELVLHRTAKVLPHTYSDNTICLHLPGQWRPTMLLANTTVPWTSEWLYYYEIWLITGQWHGGGLQDHPTERLPSAGPQNKASS